MARQQYKILNFHSIILISLQYNILNFQKKCKTTFFPKILCLQHDCDSEGENVKIIFCYVCQKKLSIQLCQIYYVVKPFHLKKSDKEIYIELVQYKSHQYTCYKSQYICIKRKYKNIRMIFLHFLASQDALEVMLFTY